jgi:hypothetical protein
MFRRATLSGNRAVRHTFGAYASRFWQRTMQLVQATCRRGKLVERGDAPTEHCPAALSNEVCHYMTQPLVELYGGCMVVLKVL